jgi:hypothetical protein
MIRCKTAIVVVALSALLAALALTYLRPSAFGSEPALTASAPSLGESKTEPITHAQAHTAPQARQQTAHRPSGLPPLPKTQLQYLIDEALIPGKSPESRALALRLSLACITTGTLPAFTLEDVKQQNDGLAIQVDATLREVEQARMQMSKFCSTGAASELMDRLRQANLPAFGPSLKSLVQWKGGARNQEYFQAATQVLANPDAYAVQFDTWLSKDLSTQLREKYSLSRNQSVYVQDALYNEFVTANSAHAFRVMERCAQFAICPTSVTLTSEETVQAQRVAAQLQLAIQQQRWGLLIPQ